MHLEIKRLKKDLSSEITEHEISPDTLKLMVQVHADHPDPKWKLNEPLWHHEFDLSALRAAEEREIGT